MKKKLLGMFAMLLFGGMLLSGTAQAQISTAAPVVFQYSIPDAYRWVTNLAGPYVITTDVAPFTSADFNATANNESGVVSDNHQFSVADGTIDGATDGRYLYMETNSVDQANTQNYRITIADNSGTTATFADASTINLQDTDNGSDINVNVLITDRTFASNATLGGDTFTAIDGTNIGFNGATLTTIPVPSGGSAAALDLGLDFDESTLGYDDTVGASDETIGFSLTFTVLGVN